MKKSFFKIKEELLLELFKHSQNDATKEQSNAQTNILQIPMYVYFLNEGHVIFGTDEESAENFTRITRNDEITKLTKFFTTHSDEFIEGEINNGQEFTWPNLPSHLFSQQEIEILFHLIRGKTAKEIAKNLRLSHRTIEHRIEKIKIRIGATSRSDLIEKIFDELK